MQTGDARPGPSAILPYKTGRFVATADRQSKRVLETTGNTTGLQNSLLFSLALRSNGRGVERPSLVNRNEL